MKLSDIPESLYVPISDFYAEPREDILYVVQGVAEEMNISKDQALDIVLNSHFPKCLLEMPDFVLHYDYLYWAKDIIDAYHEHNP